MRRAVPAVVLGVSVLSVLSAGCSSDPVLGAETSGTTVVVGSGTSNRDELIAQVYANALARTGVQTSVAERADRAANLARLDAGDVELVADYTGGLLAYLNPGAPQTAPDDVFAALNKSLPQGLSSTDYGVAQDGLTLYATPETVRALGGASLEAFGPHCAELTVGVAAPLPEATTTRLGDEYGCAFGDVRTYPADALPAAVTTGEVAAALLPGMSSATDDVIPIADDAHAFVAQNVVPVFRTGALSDAAILKLNVVGAELTTSDLVTLEAQVEGGDDPGRAARAWLDQRGL